jgi:hypothetical protein
VQLSFAIIAAEECSSLGPTSKSYTLLLTWWRPRHYRGEAQTAAFSSWSGHGRQLLSVRRPMFPAERTSTNSPVVSKPLKILGFLFFASDRSSRTTGAMIAVDGGVREAFVR